MTKDSTASLGLLIFRLALGFTFIMHGFQKAFLNGPTAQGAIFAKMGIPAPELSAYFTIGAELIGGIMLLLGIGTRIAAAAITIAMAGAYIFVHVNAPFIIDPKTGAGFMSLYWAWRPLCLSSSAAANTLLMRSCPNAAPRRASPL